MEILTEEQELLLKNIIDFCDSSKKYEINCPRDNIDRALIDSLIENGYVKDFMNKYTGVLYLVSPTLKGNEYFANKDAYRAHMESLSKKETKAKIADWLKYGITTAIALAALFISIFC